MEVFRMLPEGTRAEVIDNTLYMSPSPTSNHQAIVGELFFMLFSHVRRNGSGRLFVAPLDVYLDGELTVVQPDVMFISTRRANIIRKDGIHGSPDVIFEVLSSPNAKHDTGRKKLLYALAGVQEYWIINPETKRCIGYTLIDDRYELIADMVAQIPSVCFSHTFGF
ncbi:MAG: Uma2 family endonuclease [Bacteroidia bacterium]|nr:Uma2 family endonuclease [Bacteroidia bacterium]